jgi:hypothetical protein
MKPTGARRKRNSNGQRDRKKISFPTRGEGNAQPATTQVRTDHL